MKQGAYEELPQHNGQGRIALITKSIIFYKKLKIIFGHICLVYSEEVFLCATGAGLCNEKEGFIKGDRRNTAWKPKAQNIKSVLSAEARLIQCQMISCNFLIHLGLQILFTIGNSTLFNLKFIPRVREQ